MKHFAFILLLWVSISSFAQQSVSIDSLYKPDPLYLEDQLYFSISYIALRNLPAGLKQNGFSNAVRIGYVRDIPINEQRNFGFALGVGYAHDAYFHNLRISVDEGNGNIKYNILKDDNYQSNSFSINKFEIPFEIRWRGSTPTKFKFWRLYAGATASYVFSTSSNYVTNDVDITYKNIKIINPWQYGLTLSLGYGTWNFNYYYGLNNIIKDNVVVDGVTIKMKVMRFGIIYYFL